MFVLIDELITINNRNKFEKNDNEIYPPELYFLKTRTSPTETAFLDLHLYKNEVPIQISLYDKGDSLNFNIPSKNFL